MLKRYIKLVFNRIKQKILSVLEINDIKSILSLQDIELTKLNSTSSDILALINQLNMDVKQQFELLHHPDLYQSMTNNTSYSQLGKISFSKYFIRELENIRNSSILLIGSDQNIFVLLSKKNSVKRINDFDSFDHSRLITKKNQFKVVIILEPILLCLICETNQFKQKFINLCSEKLILYLNYHNFELPDRISNCIKNEIENIGQLKTKIHEAGFFEIISMQLNGVTIVSRRNRGLDNIVYKTINDRNLLNCEKYTEYLIINKMPKYTDFID